MNWVALDWLIDGKGYLAVDMTLFGLIIAAVFLHAKLVWSRVYLPEMGVARSLIIATRRMKLAAYVLLLARYGVALYAAGDIPIPLPSEIAWTLIVLCDVIVVTQRLIMKTPDVCIR